MRANTSKILDCPEDKYLYGVVYALITLFFLIVLYPLIYVVSSSFSSSGAVLGGRVWLWPVEPSLTGYQYVFQYKEVFTSFRNSVLYTLSGTAINLC
ncbi:MAG: carbohydrate ABC transporter permease, partial [Clostridiales bacterium]|nr:carbohydrate ABC transporter permease [Clostridiales bacterium]